MPEKINQEIRYFGGASREFRRWARMRSASASGAPASSRDTSCIGIAPRPRPLTKFDGTLFYQMHLTANVLVDRAARCSPPRSWCMCRNNRPPESGSSSSEKGKYLPGRLHAGGAAEHGCGRPVRSSGTCREFYRDRRGGRSSPQDYANYFLPLCQGPSSGSPSRTSCGSIVVTGGLVLTGILCFMFIVLPGMFWAREILTSCRGFLGRSQSSQFGVR